TVQLPKDNNDVGGRILLGYRSVNDPYITVGLGGCGFVYNMSQFDRVQGWRPVAWSGSQDNLISNYAYEISVRARGQKLILEVDDIQVLEHVLDTPMPQAARSTRIIRLGDGQG